jgi:hypothetical protein
MIDLALIYVAVVAMVGTLPVGFFLGLRYAAARAELRRPAPAHEALAAVYEFPTPKAILSELRGPLPGGRV